MVEFKTPALDAVFHALGDGTRRSMLQTLSRGPSTVGQLAEPFRMSLAAASKHVKALEGAGLIRREVRGRTHICTLEAAPLARASDWLRHYEQFWTTRLDRLEALLGGDAGPSPGAAPARPPARKVTAKAASRTTPGAAPGGTTTPPRRKAARSRR